MRFNPSLVHGQCACNGSSSKASMSDKNRAYGVENKARPLE